MSTEFGAATNIRFAGWEVWPVERKLLVNGQIATVGDRAFDVLMALIARGGALATRDELLQEVWGRRNLLVEDGNLYVQVSTLRGLLGKTQIATVPSVGYRLTARRAEEPSGTSARSASARRGNLPAVLSRLIGRDEDVTELVTLVSGHRLVTLDGTGGIGKTRLAQAAGDALQASFPDGVWWVELAPLGDDESQVAATVARALGLTLAGGNSSSEQTINALHASFGDARLLVILDNCERVLGAVSDFVQAALQQVAGLHLLTTSQERLGMAEELLHHVVPLSMPKGHRIEELEAASATALLLARVRSLEPIFELNEGVASDLIDICRRLDGLPLAIELAAARVPVFGPQWVRQRLDQQLHMLSGGSSAAPQRHRTLRETMAWSHSLLKNGEEMFFRYAGVFAGSFSLEMMHAVLADFGMAEWHVANLLTGLIKKSLLSNQRGRPGRFMLLETARAYALELLEQHNELPRARRLHAGAVLTLFEASISDRWKLATPERVATYRPDIENCRAALDWAAKEDRALHVALAGASAWLWGATGQSKEGMDLCDRAMGHADERMPDAQKGRLLLGWCELAHYQPRENKLHRAHEVVSLWRTLGDVVNLFSSLGRLAISLSLVGRCADAEAAVAEMQTLYNPAWPPLAQWELLHAQDYVANMEHRYREGEALAHKQLDLARRLGDTPKELFAMLALQQCAVSLGRLDDAVERARALLERARGELFVDRMHAYVCNLATALLLRGDVDEGLEVSRDAVQHCRRTSSLWLQLDSLALLALRRGKLEVAARLVGRADAANGFRNEFREPVEKQIRRTMARELSRKMARALRRECHADGIGMSDDELAEQAIGP